MNKRKQKKIRIGALISGSGTNLQAIINACENGQINGQVVFVGSDKPSVKGLKRAKKFDIPRFVVSYKKIIQEFNSSPLPQTVPDDFNLKEMIEKQNFFSEGTERHKVEFFLITRAIAEAKILARMKKYQFDLLVLAGFMRNLTPYFIDRVNLDPDKPRIMNIHPALLPAFPGTDGYGDTHRYGCKVGGCTVHFIDYGEDTGSIIGQKVYKILPGDNIETIKRKGLRLEYELYPECIQLFAENRLRVVDGEPHPKTGKTKKIVKILD